MLEKTKEKQSVRLSKRKETEKKQIERELAEIANERGGYDYNSRIATASPDQPFETKVDRYPEVTTTKKKGKPKRKIKTERTIKAERMSKIPKNGKNGGQISKNPSKGGLKISKGKVKSRYKTEEIKKNIYKKDNRIRHDHKKKTLNQEPNLRKKKNPEKPNKARKMKLPNIPQSKSTINIQTNTKGERMDGFLDRSKNGSRVNIKMKTKQSKAKGSRIKRKNVRKEYSHESLHSDSEHSESDFIECGDSFDKSGGRGNTKNNEMPLVRDRMIDPPPKITPFGSKQICDVNGDDQEKWLSPQPHVSNPYNEPYRIDKADSNEPDINDLINKVFGTSRLSEKNGHSDYTIKKDFESCLEQNSTGKIPEDTKNRPSREKLVPVRPAYMSIIHTTAAIIIQNAWRERRSKLTNKSDFCSSILQFKYKIENNLSSFTNSHSNHDMVEEAKQREPPFQTIQEEVENC